MVKLYNVIQYTNSFKGVSTLPNVTHVKVDVCSHNVTSKLVQFMSLSGWVTTINGGEGGVG